MSYTILETHVAPVGWNACYAHTSADGDTQTLHLPIILWVLIEQQIMVNDTAIARMSYRPMVIAGNGEIMDIQATPFQFLAVSGPDMNWEKTAEAALGRLLGMQVIPTTEAMETPASKDNN